MLPTCAVSQLVVYPFYRLLGFFLAYQQWVHTQRKLNNKGTLRPDRKKELEAIGFAWQGQGAKRERTPTRAKREMSDSSHQEDKWSRPLPHSYAQHGTPPSHYHGGMI